MKPSATQIFRSTSPATCFFILGSCVFIGFLSWALIPMQSFVDFQVDWPKLQFKSRPQCPCCDIIHVATLISRCDINLSLCSFQLVSSDVATSISCRDITLCLCRFQLVAHDVATSISCRDNNLRNYKLQLIALGVATSFSCRDITLWLCRFHLMVPDVATSISCRDISSRNCNFQLSTSDVATSVPCRDINLCLGGFTGCFWCRDFSPLSRQQLDFANYFINAHPPFTPFSAKIVLFLEFHAVGQFG